MPHSGAGGPPKGGPPALRFVRRIFPAVHAAGAASAAVGSDGLVGHWLFLEAAPID